MLDEAVIVGQVSKTQPTETRRPLGMRPDRFCLFLSRAVLTVVGRILLKGDNISLIQNVSG